MYKPNHIYLVFNPFLNENSIYPTQAHEFYFALKNKLMAGDFEKNFMYWGKLNMATSSAQICDNQSIELFNNIIAENKKMGEDTHLYVSDYHHFWIGKIESAHREVSCKEHILPFYDNKDVESWLKVTDFDLISAEFEETSLYLKQLYCDENSPYVPFGINGITPYISGVQFPLVVQNNNSDRYFADMDLPRISKENPLIENPKLMGEVYQQVKSFVLTPQTYRKISHKVRKELLSAEACMANMNGDTKLHYNNILGSYLKIFQMILSDTIGAVLRLEFGDFLYIDKKGKRLFESGGDDKILLKEFKGEIQVNLIYDLFYHAKEYGNISFDKMVKNYHQLFSYFQEELIPFIEEYEVVAKLDSIKENKVILPQKLEILSIRNRILGIGNVGILNNLMRLMIALESEQQRSHSSHNA